MGDSVNTPAGAGPIIDVKGLSKTFGAKTVVRDLDIQVHQGDIFGFLGPNGSGKTTFIRMLCGLLSPDTGTGRCLGYDIINEADKIKPKVGYLSQKFSLYDDLTVQENLMFIARVYDVRPRRKSVERCIERMQLGRFRKQLAGSLSGGWKQRLALASCILHDPKLLLLDEPTAGVDPSARRDFWDEVHKLASEGITSLISTHYMDEAERCSRLGYIAYGDLLAKGTGDELIANSGLQTLKITGPDLYVLSGTLRNVDGVEQAAAFGVSLHVSGRDLGELERSIATHLTAAHSCEPIQTTLEEVFINLMDKVLGK